MNLVDAIKNWYKRDVISYKIDHIDVRPPTVKVNPPRTNYIWYDKKAGVIWICIDNTPDKNIWKSTSGELIAPKTVTTVDIFKDGSALGLWTFDRTLKDLGGKYDAKLKLRYGRPADLKFVPGKFDYCVKHHWSQYQLEITIPGMSQLQEVTVSFWAQWERNCCTMPIGFKTYDLYTCCNYFGFNTGNGDIYGIKFTDYAYKWIHIVATFKQGQYGNLWINGQKQTLNQKYGRINAKNAVITDSIHIFGWGANSSYRAFGLIDQLRIFNRALTDEEVNILYHEVG